MKRLAPILALLVLLGAANMVVPAWHSQLFHAPVENRNRLDLFLDILGELRTFLGRTVYMQADVYHHVMESQGIPWTREKDILPIYRMATILDPRIEDAYETAAYDLVVNFGRPDEGFTYLDEGIRANPKSPSLWLTRAFLLFHDKRYQDAVPAAQRALQLATDPYDTLNAARILSHAWRGVGNREGEIRALRFMLTMMPDEPFAQQRLVALGVEPRGFTPEEAGRWKADPTPGG